MGGFWLRQTASPTSSQKLGLTLAVESMPFLMTFIDSTSSTRPRSQELPTMRRLTPVGIGILDGRSDSSTSRPCTVTSMNVRRHLFLQK